MFDNASRSLFLENQLWPALREEFPALKQLPKEALVQVGYPSTGARGKSSKMKPCEINKQWTGNPNEPVMISVHPVQFQGKDEKERAFNVAKALAFGALKHTSGFRWGAVREGLNKEEDGTITADANCTKRLERVLEQCGELPAGYGLNFPVRQVQATRARMYWAPRGTKADGSACSHTKVRTANDNWRGACIDCGTVYQKA